MANTMTTVRIERATINDAAGISSVAIQAGPLPFKVARIALSKENQELMIESAWRLGAVILHLKDPKKQIMIARGASNQILGFTLLSLDDSCPIYLSGGTQGNEKHASLEGLYVDPTAHRQGVRNKLLEQVMSDARKLSLTHIWLMVLEGNYPAQNLYEKYGFFVVGDTGFPPGLGMHNDLIMVQPL
ncbi:hypothetical protein M426DRAFT_262435 [Hypoxylon sp. CI-4A]|nr:hypothetical protein M426DRAFT_262435 [Hypoxylon sp. CI-4A]